MLMMPANYPFISLALPPQSRADMITVVSLRYMFYVLKDVAEGKSAGKCK